MFKIHHKENNEFYMMKVPRFTLPSQHIMLMLSEEIFSFTAEIETLVHEFLMFLWNGTHVIFRFIAKKLSHRKVDIKKYNMKLHVFMQFIHYISARKIFNLWMILNMYNNNDNDVQMFQVLVCFMYCCWKKIKTNAYSSKNRYGILMILNNYIYINI